jgi:hypothetical protein
MSRPGVRVLAVFVAVCVLGAVIYATTSSAVATSAVSVVATAAGCAALFLAQAAKQESADTGKQKGTNVAVRAKHVRDTAEVIGVDGGHEQPGDVSVTVGKAGGNARVWGWRGTPRGKQNTP